MTWRVMAERCDQCLFTPGRIVSNDRRADVLATCRDEGRAFTCHKASLKGDNVSCRGYYDQDDRLLAPLAVAAKRLHEVTGAPTVTFVREDEL